MSCIFIYICYILVINIYIIFNKNLHISKKLTKIEIQYIMSDTYVNEAFPFKANDVIKVSLFYSYKRISLNDIRFSRIFYFKIVTANDVSIESFFKLFISTFLVDGFCKIQSESVCSDKIKVESALKIEKNVLIKHIKSIYGHMSDVCDPNKGFQLDLFPAKGGSVKRLYLRGIPDSLAFFGFPEHPDLKTSVIKIEKLFLEIIGGKDLSFRFVTLSKANPYGVESITAAEASRLYVFNKKRVIKQINETKNKFK